MAEEMDNLEGGASEESNGSESQEAASSQQEQQSAESTTKPAESRDNSDAQAQIPDKLKGKSQAEIVDMYLNLEKKLGEKELTSIEDIKARLLEDGDFVSKTDLAREKETTSFIQERPDLKDRLPALQALQRTDEYKGKSLKEIAADLYGGQATTSVQNRITRKVELGESPRDVDLSSLDEESIRNLPDEEFDEMAKGFMASGLVKR